MNRCIDVDTYKRTFRVQKTGTIKAIETFRHLIKWKKHMNILDVGCGEGSTTVNILKPLIEENTTSYKLTAVDVSDAMIESARETFQNEENVVFELMDIGGVNLGNQHEGHFDLIVSFFCLQLIPNYNDWIRNVFKMLKSNGQIFLLTVGESESINQFFNMKESAKWSAYLQDVCFWESPLLSSSDGRFLIAEGLQLEGFQNVFHAQFDHDTISSDKTYIREFFKAFSALYEHIPTHLVDEFLDELAAKVFQVCFKFPSLDYYLRFSLYVFIADK